MCSTPEWFAGLACPAASRDGRGDEDNKEVEEEVKEEKRRRSVFVKIQRPSPGKWGMRRILNMFLYGFNLIQHQ
jgi:hypothetical protein